MRETGQLEGEATKGGDMGRRAPFGDLHRRTHSEVDSDEGPSGVGCRGLQESMVDPDPTSRRGKTALVGRSGQGVRQQGRDRWFGMTV